MSYPNQRSALRFFLLFALSYFIPALINQNLLGNNPTITLILSLYIGSVVGLLALKTWHRYKRLFGHIPTDQIVHMMEPRTVVTVIGFFSFATILGALNQYGGMGLSGIIQLLTIGPFLVAVSSGNIPLILRRRRRDWRSR